MALMNDIETSISSINSTYDLSTVDKVAMKKYAWKESADYFKSQSSSNVTENTISNGALTSGTLDDWGLSLFKANLRNTILQGNSLVPFKCDIHFKKRYILVVNANIYKFSTNTSSYINSVKAGVPGFAARYYFIQNSETTNANTALSNAQAAVNQQLAN